MKSNIKDSVSPVEADTERNEIDKPVMRVSLSSGAAWALLGASVTCANFWYLHHVPGVYDVLGCLLASLVFYYLAARSDAHE